VCAQGGVLHPERKLDLLWWVWACRLPAPPPLAPGSSGEQAHILRNGGSKEASRHCSLCSPHPPPHLSSGYTGFGGKEFQSDIRAWGWELWPKGSIQLWSSDITCLLAHDIY